VGLLLLSGGCMRELERTRIGKIIPGNDWIMDFGYILEVITFIGVNPVNRDYIYDGNLKLLKLFPTKGEAMDYAVEQMQCKQVVFTTMDDKRCSIVAHVRDSAFFNVEPLNCTICH